MSTKTLTIITGIAFLLISISALQNSTAYADSDKHEHNHQHHHQHHHVQYDLTDREELYPVTDVGVGD